MEFYDLKSFDFSKIKFPPKKSKTGTFIKMYYDKKAFGFALPKTKVLFDTNDSKFGISLNIDVNETPEYIDKFTEFDDNIQRLAIEKDFVTLEYKYFSCIKTPSNSRYSKYLAFKFQKKRNNEDSEQDPNPFSTVFYNGCSVKESPEDDPEELKVESIEELCNLLKKGTLIDTAVEVGGIWVRPSDKTFGTFFKIDHIQINSGIEETVKPPPQDPFNDFSDTESESSLEFDD